MLNLLDKRILGFRQTVREFLSSKTNRTAVASIVGLITSYAMGVMPLNTFLPSLLIAIFSTTIYDKLADK